MYYVGKFIVWIYMHLAYRLRYKGRENIPKDTVAIYASNHRSFADPPLVGTGTRGKCVFMAKEELFKNKLFGGLIRMLGAFPVSRGNDGANVIDVAVKKIEKNRNLIIFPEGTRSRDGKVRRGHSGAAVIAAKTGKPIIPVGVVYGDKLKFRTKLTVVYGKPIMPEEYCEISDNPNPRQLVKLKNRYMDEIKSLVEGSPRPKEDAYHE